MVKKEANRCIVCMRCVRYCDEIMGEDALTAHQRGVRTEISSFDRQPLECEQCGNCIEVCPVGALTALPYRFKARPWDLRQHVTICPWCSNGCSVRLGVRGMEILRARGTERRGVNQEYLCVRGRFGYEFVNDAERLTSAAGARSGGRAGAGLVRRGGRPRRGAAARDRRRATAPDAVAFLGGEKLEPRGAVPVPEARARRARHEPRGRAHALHRAASPGAAILQGHRRRAPARSRSTSWTGRRRCWCWATTCRASRRSRRRVLIRGQHQQGLHLTVAHPRRVKLARAKFGGDWLGLRPGSELALLNGLTRAALEPGRRRARRCRPRSRRGCRRSAARSRRGRPSGRRAGDRRAGGGDRRGGRGACARRRARRHAVRPRARRAPAGARRCCRRSRTWAGRRARSPPSARA